MSAGSNQTYESSVIWKLVIIDFLGILLIFAICLATWPDTITNNMNYFGHWIHQTAYHWISNHWQP